MRELDVERLEQRYSRIADTAGLLRYDYSAPAFDYRSVLSFDTSGLVVDYPGIAARVL